LGIDALAIRRVNSENDVMASSNPPTAVPFADVLSPELEADTRAVIEKLMTGKPLDPETYRRIQERADRIRDEVYRRHGLLDIGVPAIRAFRDGDDE
jgi:hypothetical protein